MIKKAIGKFIPLSLIKQLINFKILAVDYAQYMTIRRWDCVDKCNNKIPWYTYPAIEYLTNLDFNNKLIFEYGSGNSSIFWSKRARHVTSVEHNEEWFQKVKRDITNNQEILLIESSCEYENSIQTKDQKYDVIVIDGVRRLRCAKAILNCVNNDAKEGFMVILDNSDWYKDTAKYLREDLNLIEIDFHGYGPINHYTWTTSIFLSRNFNFKPIADDQPHFSIGALQQNGEQN